MPIADPLPAWLTEGLGAPGRALVTAMWDEHVGWSASDLRLLRMAGEALDRGTELRAAIAATADADEAQRLRLLRHERATMATFAMLMRPLTPRAER